MAVLNVLVDAKGKVAGTAQVDDAAPEGAPKATLVPGEGQRVVTVTVADDAIRLDPSALHELLEKKHRKELAPPRRAASPARSPRRTTRRSSRS
jgi:hypothetical protein